MFSKDFYRQIFNWLTSFVLQPDGSPSKLWRLSVVILILLNLVFLIIWQRDILAAFWGEWNEILGEECFPPLKVQDLSILFYGPTMLVESAIPTTTLMIRNDGESQLCDIHLALFSPDGAIRVNGGAPMPNSLRITQLLPGATYEQHFELVTTGLLSQATITPMLNLEVSYRSSGLQGGTIIDCAVAQEPGIVISHHITRAYTFKTSRFVRFHGAVGQLRKMGMGTANNIMELSASIKALFAAIIGLIVIIVTPIRQAIVNFGRPIVRWINNIKGTPSSLSDNSSPPKN